MVGARHAVGAHQGTAIDLDADHGELSILEAETGIAGRGEAEKRIGPMPDSKNFLSIERAHGFWFPGCSAVERLYRRACGSGKGPKILMISRVNCADDRDSQDTLTRNCHLKIRVD